MLLAKKYNTYQKLSLYGVAAAASKYAQNAGKFTEEIDCKGEIYIIY
jgi:hypothetical protein